MAANCIKANCWWRLWRLGPHYSPAISAGYSPSAAGVALPVPALQLITYAELLRIHPGCCTSTARRRYFKRRNYITVEPAATDGGLHTTVTLSSEKKKMSGYIAVRLQGEGAS